MLRSRSTEMDITQQITQQQQGQRPSTAIAVLLVCLLLSHLQLWRCISDVVVVRVLVQVARDDLQNQSAFRSYYVISRDRLSLASLVGWKKRQSTF